MASIPYRIRNITPLTLQVYHRCVTWPFPTSDLVSTDDGNGHRLPLGGYSLSFTETLGSQVHQSCGEIWSRTEGMWLPQPNHVALPQVPHITFIHILNLFLDVWRLERWWPLRRVRLVWLLFEFV
ncbi:hypothetical protein F4804DRAFT_296889 [Jackrogersella minutella]|nr:hypothetical protein F4804DRAFT_296889 [Jackrogersella minutella]